MNRLTRADSDFETVLETVFVRNALFDREALFELEKRPSHTRMGLCFMLLTPVNPK
jgi:hypothetical protein